MPTAADAAGTRDSLGRRYGFRCSKTGLVYCMMKDILARQLQNRSRPHCTSLAYRTTRRHTPHGETAFQTRKSANRSVCGNSDKPQPQYRTQSNPQNERRSRMIKLYQLSIWNSPTSAADRILIRHVLPTAQLTPACKVKRTPARTQTHTSSRHSPSRLKPKPWGE